MVVSPLDNYYVISSFSHNVIYVVLIVALVFDVHLLARTFRAVHSHKQYVSTLNTKVTTSQSIPLVFFSLSTYQRCSLKQ